MKTWFALLFVVCAGFAQAKEISADDLLDLPRADVVLLGEIHDNPAHHQNQLVALRSLSPKAVVFEMLTQTQVRSVTPELLADSEELETALDWAHSGWPDFALYYPLFQALNGAQVMGAQLTREALREAIMGDALAAFGDDAERFGLDRPLPPEQQEKREALQFEAHCNALPKEMLPGMVMAQRLRDAALARAITQAFDETGGPVAVITGNGHAQNAWGVPVVLAFASPELEVLSIGQFEAIPEGEIPHDLWLVTAPAEREDPCVAFS